MHELLYNNNNNIILFIIIIYYNKYNIIILILIIFLRRIRSLFFLFKKNKLKCNSLQPDKDRLEIAIVAKDDGITY